MTNKNYTLMSNIELLDEINSIDKKPVALQAFIQKTSHELWKEIKHRTLFLEDGTFDHISIDTSIERIVITWSSNLFHII